MAPDRGKASNSGYHSVPSDTRDSADSPEEEEASRLQHQREDAQQFIADHANEGQNFTLRGILVGLGVGLIICFSNMYFGLQTGWISGMSMPASLMGFAFFKALSKHLDIPFTPVENVLVQTVAGSMGTMPLSCGFVGVMPALNYLLAPEENGPLFLSTWKLCLWALGLCFFGVVFAVPLRRQVIIREKLKFPSGTATALMIGVLHGKEATAEGPIARPPTNGTQTVDGSDSTPQAGEDEEGTTRSRESDWKSKLKLLLVAFGVSGIYTLATYFFPILRDLPVFGTSLAADWLWTFNPSFAYVGQGIIMGPATTTHMLIGAIVGWAILSPLAKNKGWAPGRVDDWETGSKGWIVWISLAIMLADAVISLGYIAGQPIYLYGGDYVQDAKQKVKRGDWKNLFKFRSLSSGKGYAPLSGRDESSASQTYSNSGHQDEISLSPRELRNLDEPDAPPEHLVSNRAVWIGLALSISFCIFAIRITFGSLVPIYALIIAVFMALILSIMGVRALGETDLNPVSGISKLAQLFFALIIPQSNKNSIIVNLVAGAVSEAGAMQAGDLMQDLKTGHLLGAAPNAQFWGQLIGSGVGAIVSAFVYKLYVNTYEVPGKLFQVPTGYVWIFTARLVTGKGLPTMAAQWATGAAIIFVVVTIIRIYGMGTKWHPWIPGGIAVAVGMYNVPSFTLARAVGGFVNLYWRNYRKREDTPMVILASGLILGEGVVSILNLILASAKVPHL